MGTCSMRRIRPYCHVMSKHIVSFVLFEGAGGDDIVFPIYIYITCARKTHTHVFLGGSTAGPGPPPGPGPPAGPGPWQAWVPYALVVSDGMF